MAVFAATSTFGRTLSDKIVHGIVPGLGGPQNLQVADAGNVGGGDSDEPGTGSVGGGAGTPPDWEPDTGSVGGSGGGYADEGDTGSVGGTADDPNPGSE